MTMDWATSFAIVGTAWAGFATVAIIYWGRIENRKIDIELRKMEADETSLSALKALE